MKFIKFKYLIIIILVFIFNSALSQNNKEEVINEIDNIADTILRINKYNEYAEKYINSDSFAIKLLNKSLKLSEKKIYEKGLLKTYELFTKIFEIRQDTIKIQRYLVRTILIREKNKLNFPNDTSNINKLIDLYTKISIYYQKSKELNRAIDYYKKILIILKTKPNLKILANTQKNIGWCYLSLNEYDKCIENYKQSLILFIDLKDNSQIYEIYLILANVYFYKGEFKNSLNYNFLALNIAEDLDNFEFKISCFLNISQIYNILELYDKALEYNNKSLDIALIQNDSLKIANVYINLAEIYFSKKEFLQALNYYNKSKYLLENLNQKILLAYVYNGLGITYDELQKFEEANKYLLLSLSIRKKENNIKEIADSYINLGEHYLLTNKIKEAEIYILKGYLIANEIHNLIEIRNSSKILSQLYFEKKEFEKAYNYITLYYSYTDSIINQHIANDIAKFELEYEYNQESKLKEAELKDAKKFGNLLILTIVFLLGFVIVVIYNNFLRKNKNKELRKHQQKIESQNQIIQQKSDEYEKLALVASKSDNGVIIMDKDANIEWINESFIVKYAEDSKLVNIRKGENLYKVSSKENIKELITECINSKKSIHYDYYNNNELKPLWIQTTLTPIFVNNNLIKLIAVDTDVTDIKIAESQIILQKNELEKQADLLSLYISQLTAQKIAVQENNEELQQQREELITQTEMLEITNHELAKLSIVASKTDNSIFILTPDGTITWVNEALKQLTGYNFDEYKNKFGNNILKFSSNPNIVDDFEYCLKSKKTVIYQSKIISKKDNIIWLQTTLTPILDEYSQIIQIVGIDTDITKIKLAEEKITEQNKEITDSIQYASRIQKALLPMDIYVNAVFENYFIFNRPRDIVSGDFYWLGYRDNKVIIALADCTGHGIPGAFMSMLGLMSFNNIVYRIKNLKTDEILNTLKETIINLLHQRGKSGESHDGMDVALCIIDFDNLKLQYSGANSPIYIVEKEKDTDGLSIINIYKANKMPIGYYEIADESFTEHIIDIKPDDMIYLSSDGFKDQFGGDEDKKYLNINFKNLLRKINHLPTNNQKKILEKEFEDWKGDTPQIDDIMIIGIKV